MSLTGSACKSAGDGLAKLTTAEGDKGIVEERGAIGSVWGGDAEKGLEKLAHHALRQVSRDEHQARSVIVIRPAVEARGWMKNVLYAMHDNRRVWHFCKLYDALQAQELRAMRRTQQFQKHLECTGGDRVFGRQDERADVLIVTVDVVMVMMVAVGMSFGGEPLPDVRNFLIRIIKPAAEKAIRHGLALGCIEDRRRGIECPQASRNPLRSEEHTSELQSLRHLVCRLLLEKKKAKHCMA